MTDLEPRLHWRVRPPWPIDDDAIAAAKARSLSPRLVRVLTRRAPVTTDSLAAWFGDPEAGLHDPALLPDADRCRARVRRAVEAGERVLVFGDFDADGLTGLSILATAVRELGLDVVTWVPSRVDEGHGLSRAAVEHAIAERRTLILTADCGSTSHEEIALAARDGVDVIVTDHHSLPPALPDAVAIVNPHRADATYPDRGLSGAGVAFKVAQLLLADLPDGAERALALADLAVIGTIADVVTPEGENRSIVRLGLRRLANAPRPGLRALLDRAGVDLARIDRETISHVLAPRINAPGRIGSADEVAALLLAEDDAEADRLAAVVDAANVRRRELTRAAMDDARARLAADAPGEGLLILAGPWPIGVIGLVAGKLAEETGRPTLILSDAQDPWRGSARGPAGFDLAAAFRACDPYLVRHGGHPAAAGCTVEAAQAPAFIEALRSLPATAPSGGGRAPVEIDLVVGADAVDFVLLEQLAPIELAGDPPPVIGVAGLVVRRVRAANGGHAQLTLEKGNEVVDAICFGRGDLAERLRPGQAIDVAGRITRRTWGGVESLRIDVADVAPAGHLRSLRASGEAR